MINCCRIYFSVNQISRKEKSLKPFFSIPFYVFVVPTLSLPLALPTIADMLHVYWAYYGFNLPEMFL